MRNTSEKLRSTDPVLDVDGLEHRVVEASPNRRPRFWYASWQLPASRMAVRRMSCQPSRSPCVVSSSLCLGCLLCCADAVLLRLEQIERDSVRVEGLYELAPLIRELGLRFRDVKRRGQLATLSVIAELGG
jgi:hypothetical protein